MPQCDRRNFSSPVAAFCVVRPSEENSRRDVAVFLESRFGRSLIHYLRLLAGSTSLDPSCGELQCQSLEVGILQELSTPGTKDSVLLMEYLIWYPQIVSRESMFQERMKCRAWAPKDQVGR